MAFLWFILIGLVAGYLGSLIFKGSGNGLLINLIVGIIGGFLGGWLFGLLGIGGTSIVWSLISAVVGAILLLWIVSLIKKK
ncbi:MAG: GlsB/YeaQ/YmgE family stress response membrane protein [Prevotellaceae bacterium]|jgi:uncharacterized membrane protein YeaQ/YmgE (transglycosylase-associated protein family)|nr:GlsB/YeaQ/YmgE family stress response membrane protein [Prevotellaceae bacterium]